MNQLEYKDYVKTEGNKEKQMNQVFDIARSSSFKDDEYAFDSLFTLMESQRQV